MDRIKALFSQFSGRIEIQLDYIPVYLNITFSDPPAEAVLAPIFALVDSKRFEFTQLTRAYLVKNTIAELLNLELAAKNIIPPASAAQTLKECWEDMGYHVVVIPAPSKLEDKCVSGETSWVLAEIMAKHQVKGKEIAQDLGVSEETVTTWKRQAPPLDRWDLIARCITARSRIGRQVVAKDFLE